VALVPFRLHFHCTLHLPAAVKEALDDQVDVATSKLHIQQQLQADDVR
jgi:hypothetical protein